jgi:DNA-binding beta-propeller fold protein YncE
MARDDDALRSERPEGALSDVVAPATVTPLTPGSDAASPSSSSSPTSSSAAALLAPGRYRRGGRLGRGGMGVVDAGHDPALGRDVALKRAVDAAGEARLWHEARLTARLHHPAIVSVLDLARDDDGALVAVLEVRRGDTLLAAIAADRAAWPDARGPSPRLLRALLVVCEAVGHAHARGILHRDLSLKNTVVAADGATSVLDWGLACTVDEAAASPQRLGTPGAMAPEVERGEAATTRSDVWSLGALMQHVVAAAVVPPALAAIVARATASDPAARYGDAAALADDLRRFLDGERVLAFREGPMGALARHLQRRPRAVAAAVVTVGVVAVVVIVAMVAVSRARGRADLARAAQLVEAAERALREPAPDDALAARGLADAALGLLPAGSDEALRARARGVVAATARVAATAPPPPSPPAVDEATIANLPLDGGRRVVRASADGRRVVVRATTTLALWDHGAAPRVHTPCTPGHSVLDALPVDDGALVLCAPGELLTLNDDGHARRLDGVEAAATPSSSSTPTRYQVGLALPRDDLLAVSTTRGQVRLVERATGRLHDVVALGGGIVLIDAGPRPGTLRARRPERADQRDVVIDVDSGAILPVDDAGTIQPTFASLAGPDGRAVVVDDGQGRLWLGDGGGGAFAVALRGGARVVALAGPSRVIKGIALPPAADVVVVAAAGPAGFAFFDAGSGVELTTAWQHDAEVRMRHVAFLDDDTVLAWNWNEGPFRVAVDRAQTPPRVGPLERARFEERVDLDVRAVVAGAGAVWTLLGDGRVERIVRRGEGLHRDVVATLPGGRALAVADSPAGARVVVATADAVHRISVEDDGERDVGRGGAAGTVAVTDGPIDSVAVDAHGHVGVGTRAGRVRLYDGDGRVVFDVAAHDERVAALAFCDGGAALCSGGWDGRVRVLQRP